MTSFDQNILLKEKFIVKSGAPEVFGSSVKENSKLLFPQEYLPPRERSTAALSTEEISIFGKGDPWTNTWPIRLIFFQKEASMAAPP